MTRCGNTDFGMNPGRTQSDAGRWKERSGSFIRRQVFLCLQRVRAGEGQHYISEASFLWGIIVEKNKM